MNEDLHTVSREMVEHFAEGHAHMIQWRSKMEGIGLAIFGVSLGFSLSFVFRIVFLRNSMHWWDWIFQSGSIVGFAASAFGLWINRRWLRAHRAAYQSMVGMLNSPPGSNLKKHHFDQAYAALENLEKLAVQRDKWVAKFTRKK